MPTLYVIDAFAQFFRAYHAIRTPMTSPVTHEPTNMTFGFVGMLLKLLRGEGKMGGPPDYVVVATDVSDDRGTFRSRIYPEYKAHRPPIPEGLPPQVDRCMAMLGELGIPILGAAGYEADDVIATLVTTLRHAHPELVIRIISKDKDLKQLLEGDAGAGPAPVALYDIHSDEVFDAASLREQTGLAPTQVVDMLALMGDAVDNVPGVDGVGEKTAAQLIREYGSLDALLARADEVKGKRGEKLRAASEQLALSRSLVTLDRAAPMPEFSLDAAGASRFRLERLGPILKELGFNRYQEDTRQLIDRRDGVVTPVIPMPESKAARPAGRSGPGQGSLFGESLFPAEPAGDGKPIVDGEYETITTRAALEAVVARIRGAPALAVDTETSGLGAVEARLCGVSLCVEPGKAWYVPCRSPETASHLDESEVLGVLGPILEDVSIPKILHNAKYDMIVLRRVGVRLRGIEGEGGGDTMLASYLIDSSRSSHSLDALSLAILGKGKPTLSDLLGATHKAGFESLPLRVATPYAAGDADLALRLARVMLPQLRAMGLDDLFRRIELPLVEVLAELEWNGILVDPAELDRQRGKLQSQIRELRDSIDERSMSAIGRVFDPDSPKQLSGVLFNKPGAAEPGLGLRPQRRTKTGYSTDADVLEKIAQDPEVDTPIPRLILEYRQLTKLVSTYLVALGEAINPRTGRIHASFHQAVAATGRLASSDPNLQNIPIRTEVGRDIRKAFIAPPGRVLITADYSQIELRLLAHLSRDPGLTQAFLGGEDIHASVAAQIHGVPVDRVTREQRSGAKMVNFGIVYGITPFGLARRLGVGEKQAAEIITGYKRRFAGISTFLEECVAQARRYGYVETMLKRRRPIPEIDARDPVRRSLAERVAINTVVQGSAADLIKIAMIDVHREIVSARAGGSPGVLGDALMLLQIHDELVLECSRESADAACARVVERMRSAMTLSVPLVVDWHVASNWYEGK